MQSYERTCKRGAIFSNVLETLNRMLGTGSDAMRRTSGRTSCKKKEVSGIVASLRGKVQATELPNAAEQTPRRTDPFPGKRKEHRAWLRKRRPIKNYGNISCLRLCQSKKRRPWRKGSRATSSLQNIEMKELRSSRFFKYRASSLLLGQFMRRKQPQLAPFWQTRNRAQTDGGS